MAVIVPEDVQELRERADLVEVVSGHMKLKKAGRVFKGLCCFHQEKTPSFTVDPDKQLYYCHGCGAGGDVFTFIQNADGLTFSEAAERLAHRFGVTLRFEKGPGREGGTRSRLIDVCGEASRFFADKLLNAPEAEVARSYWLSRGFSGDEAREWGVGFSPKSRDALYRHLLSKKFSAEEIVAADVVYRNDQGEHVDRFRGRVMFPVSDLSGQVIGFGARAMGDDHPKYLNSRETAIYKKARLLFGLDRGKSEMSQSGTAVVCEGYTDVIALHKVGIKTAVATCGTALGEEHFALIKRFCDRVILAFDADAAGALASERGFGIHSKLGLEVLVAPLPEGKDPADVALGEGREIVEKIIAESVPLMRFVLEREIDRHRTDTPEGKAKAVRAAISLLSWEPNRVARSEHGFWVARRVSVAPEQVQLELAESRAAGGEGPAMQAVRLPGHVRVEREALTILMDSPSLLEQAASFLHQDHFTLAEHRVLLTALLDLSRTPQEGSIMDRLPDEESRRMAAALALAPSVTRNPEEVFLRLEEFWLRRQIDDLKAKLDRLDSEKDREEFDSVYDELMRLEAERRRFDER